MNTKLLILGLFATSFGGILHAADSITSDVVKGVTKGLIESFSERKKRDIGYKPPEWKPGTEDPYHPHVIATITPGVWEPAPGYDWIYPDEKNMYQVGRFAIDEQLRIKVVMEKDGRERRFYIFFQSVQNVVEASQNKIQSIFAPKPYKPSTKTSRTLAFSVNGTDLEGMERPEQLLELIRKSGPDVTIKGSGNHEDWTIAFKPTP